MKKNTATDTHAINNAYNQKYKSPLIKWYNTSMTYEEKYKLGLLTYPEYLEWQKELAEEAAKKEAAETEATSMHSDTFWQNDTTDRSNISSDEYNDFLNNNNIDVSNKTAVDFDALCGEFSDSQNESPIVHLTEEEILENVNKDIHGSSILSEEEIAALFAAANNN